MKNFYTVRFHFSVVIKIGLLGFMFSFISGEALSQIISTTDADSVFAIDNTPQIDVILTPNSGGTLTGDGVGPLDNKKADYYPDVAGIGIDSIFWEHGGTLDTMIFTVVPGVSYDTTFSACESGGAFDIDFTTPTPSSASLNYWGDGVTGTNEFDPAATTNGAAGSPYWIYVEASVTVGGDTFTNIDSARVDLTTAPKAFDLMRDTAYCQGDPGVELWMADTENGVDYILEKNGTPQETITGDGNSVYFTGTYKKGTYTAYADNGSCTKAMNNSVTVSEITTAEADIVNFSPLSVCPGGSVELGLDDSQVGVDYVLTHPNVGPVTVAGDGDSISFGYFSDSTGYYKVEATNGHCTRMLDDSIKIEHKDKPLAFDLGGTDTLCSGSPGTEIYLVSSETGVLYHLYDKKNPSTPVMTETSSTSGDSVFFSVSDTATYYVVGENASSGCITRMNHEVTYSYFDEFNVNVSKGNTAICQGSSVEIAVSNGVDHIWSPASSLDDATAKSPIASPNSTQTYKVVATDVNGCQDSAQITVTVNGLPNANAGSDQAICRGESATLSGGGSYASYSWSPDTTLSHPNSQVTKAGPSTTTNYELTVIDVNGCQNKDTVKVTVNDNPSPTVNDATICPGDSATLTATDGDTFTWNTPDTGASITKSPADTTTYTVTARYTNGCDATATGTIYVREAPSVTTDVASSFEICSGYDTTITASASGGVGTYDYRWSNGDMDASIDIAPTADASYQVTVTDDQGCQDSTTVTADVNALPNVSISNLDSAYCKDINPVTLQGVPSYVSDPGIFGPDTVVTDNNNSTATLEPQSLKPGTRYKIYYEYTDGNGCTASDTGYTWISNDTIPDPSIHNLDSVYCDDDTTPYTIQGLPDHPSGVMTFGGVPSGFTDHSDGTGTLVPKDAGTGNYSLTYTYTTSAGCAASVTKDFVIGIPFTIQVDSNYCSTRDSFKLTVDKAAGVPDGKFIVYDENDSLYSAAEGSAQAYFDPSSQGPGKYGIKYLVNDAATTCSNEDSVGFTVDAAPDARFTLDGILNTTHDIQFCQNRDTVTMKGYINNGGVYSGPGVIGNKLIPEDLAPGDYVIHYTYPDSTSCFSTDSAMVTIKPVEAANIQGLDFAYCNDTTALTITGDPSNGTFSSPWTNTDIFEDLGNGKAHFDPSAIDTSGKYTIRYKATASNGCVDSTRQEVIVNTIPDVSVTGMVDSSSLCGNAGTVSLQGNPTDSWGSFVATSGLTDHGDGTATFDPSVPSAGFVDLVYQYTDSITGCENSDTLTLDVLETPLKHTLNTVSGTFSYCANTPGVELKLNDGNTGVRYQLYKNTTSLQDDTTLVSAGDFIFDGTYKKGSYSVLATLPNGCADSMQNTLEITEKQLPIDAQPISGPDTVALGETGSYTVPNIDNSDTIIWSVPPGSSISSGAGSTTVDVLFSAVETGYDSLSVYGRNDCGMGDTAYFKVYILALPDTAGPISGPDSLCEETQNVTYSVPSLALADSIQWNLPDGFAIESGRGTESITIDLQPGASSGYVTARGVNASGKGVADTLEVTISPYPEIHISNLNSTYCASEGEHEIHATPTNGSYSDIWGDANIFEDKGGGVAVFDPSQITSGGTYPITYTATVNGCTSDTTMNVTVHELPVVSFSGLPNTICKNEDAITLTGNPADAYGTFTGSGITDHGDGTATFDPSNEATGTHTIKYHYEDSVTGCTNMASQAVDILASPKRYTLSGGGFYCEGTSGNVLTLSGGEVGTRYGLIKNGSTEVDDTTLTASGGFDFDGFYKEGDYSVYAEASNGCSDTMQNTQTITMKELPDDAQPISGDDTVAIGGTGSYTVPPIANIDSDSYHWLLPSGASISGPAHERSVDIAFSSTSAGYDSVAVYGSNTCGEGDTAYFKVYIQPLPAKAGPISGDASLCEGDQNITYSIPSLPQADSIEWSVPKGFNIVSGKGTESITVDIDSTIVNGYITARGVNASGAGESESLYVNVYGIPDVSISAVDVLDCAVDSVLITGHSSTAGASFVWNGGGETVHNDSVYASQAGEYTLTVSSNGCSNLDTVTVQEDKTPPSISIAPADTLTCANPQTTLDATTDAGSAQFVWTASSGGYIVSGDSTSQPLVASEGNYTLTVTNTINGCSSVKSRWVETDSTTIDFTLDVSDDITCATDTAKITATNHPDASYAWSGPGIVDGQGTSELTVQDTGTYALKLTNDRTGCSLTKTARVKADTSLPANVTLDKSSDISCYNSQVTLTAGSSTTGASFDFYPVSTGHVTPLSANQAMVDKADDYRMVATHPVSGCTVEKTVKVNDKRNTLNVVVSASSGEITCSSPEVLLSVTSDTTNASVDWMTENGGNIISGKTGTKALVDAAGLYIAEVTDTLTGCSNKDSILISENRTAPSIHDVVLTPDSITCVDPVSLKADVTGHSSLLWTGPGNISHPNNDSTGVDQHGIYQLTATAANGCQDTMFVDVPADTAKPNLTYTEDYPDLTCVNTQNTLQASSSTSNVTYQWSVVSGSGTLDNPTSPTPVVDGPGTYRIMVTADNGCTEQAEVMVDTSYKKPVITAFDADPDSISCVNPTVDLSGGSSTKNATLLWTTTGTGNIQFENTNAPRVDAKGSYTLTVTHPTTGCTVDSTLQVYNNFAKPDAVVDKNPGQITCNNDTVRLDGSASNGVDFDWNARNGSAFMPNDSVQKPYVTSDGLYILTVKHPHSGCTDKDSVQVTRNDSVPGITMGSVSQPTLNCAVDSSVLEISSVDQPEYWWSTTDGNIRRGDSTLRAVIDAPGTYTFTARNPVTGCTNSKSLTIDQDTIRPKVSLHSRMLTCERDTVQIFSKVEYATDTKQVSYSWTTSGSGHIVVGDEHLPNPRITEPGKYVLTLTDDITGCTRMESIQVGANTTSPDVYIDPNVNDITCSRSQVILGATTNINDASYLWTTTGSGTVVNPNSASPGVNAPGWYSVRITNNVNGCSAEDSVYVDDNKHVPDFYVDPVKDITCSRSSVELSAGSPDDVYYEWSGGLGSISDPSSALTSVDAAGHYTLTVTDKVSGCPNNTTIIVNENTDAPSAPLASDTGSCYGAPMVPIQATGNNIRWYNDPSLGAGHQIGTGSSYTPSITAVGDSVFYVTQTGANGCESSARAVVYSVYDLPSAPTATDKAICYDEPATMLEAWPSDPAYPVKWYDATDSLLATSDQYQPTQNNVGTYEFGVTQVDHNGCESPQEKAYFTIHDLPAAPVVDEDTLRICAGAPPASFVAHGTNVKWYNTMPPASPVATGNVFTPSKTATGSYTYYVTQSSSSTSCESPYQEVVYIVQPNPASHTVTGGGTYCEGSGGVPVELDYSDASVSYKLKRDGNTYITNVTGTDGALSFGTIEPEGTYTVYGTASNGCTTKMTGTAAVSVDSLPEAAGTITGDSLVCQGTAGVQYTVPAIDYADQYVWDLPAGAEITAGHDSRSITVHYTDSAQNGLVSVYGTNTCGNGDVSTGHAITVNALPADAGNITGPDSICQGSRGVSFEVPVIDHASDYVWSVPPGATIVSGSGTRSILVDFSESSTGGIVRVHGRNSCGIGASSAEHAVHVKSKPILETDPYQSVCSSTDSLIATDPGSASITWSLLNGQANIDSPNSFETEVTGLGHGENRFQVTLTGNGCADVDTVVIENNQQFVNAGADQTLCSDSYQLSGSKPESGATGTWTVEQGSAQFSDAGVHNTTISDIGKGVNVLRWTLTRNGCSSYDEVTIINDSPTQAEAGIDQYLCGDSSQLDANQPAVGGGQWSVLEGFVRFEDPQDPNTRVREVAKGDNLLRWTLTNNACSSSDTVHLVNNQVQVEAGPDQVICDYKTTMDAMAPVKGRGEWSIVRGSAEFGKQDDPKTDVFLLVSDTTVLAWNVYYNGCQSSDSLTIINNSPSKAEAGENQTIMQSSTFLNATPPDKGTGEWALLRGSGAISDKYDPKSEVTNLAFGDNLFQWKVSHEGCVSIDSVIVDNQSSGNITAGADTILCQDNMRLNASEPIQGIGEWSVVKGSANFDDKNSNTTRVTNLSRGENILKWTVIGNGVISDEVTIINNEPTQANAGPDMVYCVDSAQLSANNVTVGEGSWNLIAGEGTFEDTLKNNSKIYDLGTGKNTLRWTITNKNCQSTDDVVITNNQPTQADAGVDQTHCSDEAALYGNSPAVGEGLWTLVSGSNSVTFQDQTVGNTRVTNLGQGENTLRWTITNGNCVSSDEVVITNDNPTQANAGRDKSICVDSFRLNGNEAVIGDGSWSVINGYGDVVDSSNHESMVENLGKGGNVLRWTINHNGCISYDEVEISNDMIEAEAGFDQSLCVDSTSLSANNPGRGEGYWSVVMGSAAFEDATNPNTQVNNLDHRSENILKWTITNKACVSTDEVTIKNNSPGIVYAGVDDDVCDDSYYLKANPNYLGQGKWEALSGGATIVNDSSANTKVNGMGLGRNTFRWSVRRNGCVLHDDITIYNNLPVEAYAGENDTTCTNEYVLHAEEPPFGQGQWTVVAGSGEFEDAGVFNTTVSNLSQGANTFKWTVYNGSCSTYDEVTIVVNKPNTPRAGADQEICADSTTLQANMPGPGQSGHWEVVEGSGSFEDPSDPNSKVTHMGYGKNTFRWSIRYKNCSLYDEVTITNNMPTRAYAGQDIHVCGSHVRLDAVEATIGEGHWSLVSGQADFSDKSNPDPLVSNLGFGPNTLRWTTTNGTCTSMDEVTVYNDKATAYAGVDQEVYRDSTTLVASSVTRGEGKWIILGGSGTFDQPGSSQTKVRDLSGGVNTFRWTIDNNGCITSDEVSITYYEMPDPEFDVSTASGCPPLSVQFFNESLKVNSNFTWEFGDGNTSTNENPRHTFYHPGEYQVQLKTQGPDGSTVTEDTSIFVRELPHANFDLAPDHLYIPEQHLQCYDMSVDADRYLWHFGDDSTSTLPSPMHQYQDTGTYNIRLEVWSEYGCYDDTTRVGAVTVEQSGRIRFPSGFTPNVNGPQGGHYNVNSKNNDVFHPIVKGVQEYHLEIFNRWGVLVFRSDKVEIGWDGYYQGKLAEEGVYIYKVHGTYNNGTRFEKVGDFVLIRR